MASVSLQLLRFPSSRLRHRCYSRTHCGCYTETWGMYVFYALLEWSVAICIQFSVELQCLHVYRMDVTLCLTNKSRGSQENSHCGVSRQPGITACGRLQSIKFRISEMPILHGHWRRDAEEGQYIYLITLHLRITVGQIVCLNDITMFNWL